MMGSGWDRDGSGWHHNGLTGWLGVGAAVLCKCGWRWGGERRLAIGVMQVRLEIGGGATVSDSDGVMQMHGGRRSCKGSRWHRGGIGMGSGWYHDGLTNWSGGWRRGVMQVRLEMGGGSDGKTTYDTIQGLQI